MLSEQPSQRRAVIDVGTNSVKILVADVVDATVNPVWEEGRQTRLGRGFYATKSLQPDAIRATVETIKEFASRAKDLGCPQTRILATSAARDARNAEQLISQVHRATGLSMEVISGDLEAALSFAGLRTGAKQIGNRILALDVGGGSTECMVGGEAGLEFNKSFPLGSVRMLEEIKPPADPSEADLRSTRQWLRSFVLDHIAPHLGPLLAASKPESVFGVGGTTAILAMIFHRQTAYCRDLIEETEFTRDELSTLVDHLWALPLAERQRVPGLPPERADVIPMGAAIYEALLQCLDLPALRASVRGLRYGAMIQ